MEYDKIVGKPEVPTRRQFPVDEGWFKTLVLLKIADVFFVVEGQASDDEHPDKHEEYYYTEHTCPTNFAQGFEAIVQGGSFDPHGCFEYVRSVWMPQRYADAQKIVEERSSNAAGEPVNDLLEKLFPELVGRDVGETYDGEIVHRLNA